MLIGGSVLVIGVGVCGLGTIWIKYRGKIPMGNELEKVDVKKLEAATVATRPPAKQTTSLPFGLMSFDEFQKMCESLYRSGATPCKRWEEVMAYAIAGHERGMSLFQAFANLQLTNGRFTVWGDAIGALLFSSGLCEKFERWVEGDGDSRKGVCVTKRKGSNREHREEYSVKDAKRARLWEKKGPWQTNPDRMLQVLS